ENQRIESEKEELDEENERLKTLHSLRLELFSRLSHDLRTPVNSLIGLARLLHDEVHTPTGAQYLRSIEAAAHFMDGLVNDILDFGRLGVGKIRFEQATFSLREVLRDMERSFRFAVGEKGLSFRVEVAEDVPEFLVGDKARLKQILYNLIGNAVTYTERGGVKVKVALLKSEGESISVRFCVQDTGIGIRETELERIFEPFAQAERNGMRNQGGTGLGLAIVRQLVELQGGNIEAHSTPGEGSAFGFELNFEVDPKGPEQIPPMDLQLGEAEILVVDDNLLNRKVIAELLSRSGAHAFTAENGKIALELLAVQHFHLVLMDMKMPQMDGWETIHAIRTSSCEKMHNIPVIALTGREDPQPLFHAGFSDTLRKPVRPEVLVETVQRWLGRTSVRSIALNGDLDMDYLQEAAAGDDDLLKEMVRIYLSETPRAVEKMLTLC
ncbi:MAG: ATP-binding protein, partial [Bacteroidota bacterium]